jgi:hypothetical protein
MSSVEKIQTVLPTASMHILKFRAIDGQSVEFQPREAARFEVAPLNFAQPGTRCRDKNSDLNVVIKNAQAPIAKTGLELEGPLTVGATASKSPMVRGIKVLVQPFSDAHRL